jgi:transcription antitermination factor NusA-like protein
MKICNICLENDILCYACNEKLKKGKITNADVMLSKAIYEIRKSKKRFSPDFRKSILYNGVLVVLCDETDLKQLIGKDGRNVKLLEKNLGRRIKMIKYSRNKKRMIMNAMGNVPIIGINVVYTKDGEKFRVRVKNKYAKKVSGIPDMFKILTDDDVELVFE